MVRVTDATIGHLADLIAWPERSPRAVGFGRLTYDEKGGDMPLLARR